MRFVFLFFITVIVFVLGMLQGSGPVEVVGFWGDGFFELLEFTMQVTLFVVLGFALASTPPVSRALRALARLPRGEVQVIIVTVLVMMVLQLDLLRLRPRRRSHRGAGDGHRPPWGGSLSSDRGVLVRRFFWCGTRATAVSIPLLIATEDPLSR